MILGAVLAGGRSRRFGSDKALASVDGRPLVDHAIAALATVVDTVVVVGREWPSVSSLQDRPHADLGPLAAINAVMHHGRRHGFTWIVSLPCDTPFVPATLLEELIACRLPTYVDKLPVLGFWPCAAADVLDAWLARGAIRSVRSFAEAIGAVPLATADDIPNFNYRADLDEWNMRRFDRR